MIEEAPDSPEGQPEERHRIRKRDRQSPAATFKAFDAPARLSPAEQLKALRDFIREPVSDGTLRIILNTAGVMWNGSAGPIRAPPPASSPTPWKP